jgi:hypothetical protein
VRGVMVEAERGDPGVARRHRPRALSQRDLALLRRQGHIAEWHDRRIGAGEDWKGVIDDRLERARVVLLLVSADFVASDYCYDIETKRALERLARGEIMVIPIILRPTDWAGAPFARLQALPRDAKPVTKWENRDDAWLDVVHGLRAAVTKLAAK